MVTMVCGLPQTTGQSSTHPILTPLVKSLTLRSFVPHCKAPAIEFVDVQPVPAYFPICAMVIVHAKQTQIGNEPQAIVC
jgi:hypothetical protein